MNTDKKLEILIDKLQKNSPIKIGEVTWDFSYEYPGNFTYSSDLGTFKCTPFFNGDATIDIQVDDNEFNFVPIELDTIPYEEIGTDIEFIQLITPSLMEATSILSAINKDKLKLEKGEGYEQY